MRLHLGKTRLIKIPEESSCDVLCYIARGKRGQVRNNNLDGASGNALTQSELVISEINNCQPHDLEKMANDVKD